MNLESRIEKLETRHHERAVADTPPQRLRANRDADGNVTACELLTWPTIKRQREQGMTWADAMLSVQSEPLDRASCLYRDCEHRSTCRADGSPTKWGAS